MPWIFCLIQNPASLEDTTPFRAESGIYSEEKAVKWRSGPLYSVGISTNIKDSDIIKVGAARNQKNLIKLGTNKCLQVPCKLRTERMRLSVTPEAIQAKLHLLVRKEYSKGNMIGRTDFPPGSLFANSLVLYR